MAESTGANEAIRRRLLEAWRGEIEAGAIYRMLADRERAKDPRRARIIDEMADAEAGHRARLEAEMTRLGMTVPDPASVRISTWTRWQVKLAPVARILAQREAAEESEVKVRYAEPTGDPEVDRVLAEIRTEEQGHARSVRVLKRDEPEPVADGPQASLDRILGRESWHSRGGGWISGAVYGANDGLGAVFGIVAGFAGATHGSNLVLTAGLAGAIASAVSMATGAYLAEKSEAEVAHANVERERQEILEHPEEEKQELSLFYQLKGLSRAEADALAEKLAANHESFLKVLMTEEFGTSSQAGGNPLQAALAAGVSTGVGAMVPVLPLFWLSGTAGIVTAAAVSLVAHFLVGAAKSLFTLRKWWSAGFEMTVAGAIVGAVTYAVGSVFQVS